ncbi:uncharacterized protein LOC9639357 [Selaginella moellendorffii]|uniref:uncharacterized protein LOC9639357 n=1 Tax=Selaginella moellendorffii TaxID=88036 RepID=UPI000D1CD958|nr:uncharacterized protein LOC9639357 [Selaginella moellendorffii]|eukprot:XP_024538270.1 uncharacterized protein LOC9639357 [Selaginella moellendorffii]
MSKRLTDYENSIAALVVNVICSFYTLFLLDRIVLHIIAPCLSGSTASFKLQTRKKKKETVPQSISIPPVATGGEPEFMTVKIVMMITHSDMDRGFGAATVADQLVAAAIT